MEFNDRIIKEGLPKGWYIQDRMTENVALLVKETPGLWPGSTCICLRPKAMDTDKWVPIASLLAEGFDICNARKDD